MRGGSMGDGGKSPGQRSRIERIGELLKAPPASDYERLARDLGELDHAVREEISARLQPALKEKIQTMPHAEYGDKQALAKWLNGELRQHGLAIRWTVEATGGDAQGAKTYPAILVADSGNQPRRGRFQLQCRTDEGKLMKPLSTPELPVLLDHLELMVDDPDRRRWGKWTDRAARPADARGRE